MAVHLIIDGYNLIRRSSSLSSIDERSLEDGRKALMELLHDYRKIRGHKITVVFDGKHSYNLGREKERINGMDVLYSKRGEEADTVIAELARKMGTGVTIVTSDNGLLARIRAHGSVGVTSGEFEFKLREALYGDKYDEYGRDEEDYPQKGRKKGLSRRPSKKEKLKKARLKKL